MIVPSIYLGCFIVSTFTWPSEEPASLNFLVQKDFLSPETASSSGSQLARPDVGLIVQPLIAMELL